MLVIPEHKTILILPPRTGSSTLHNAVAACCPRAFMLYRHAEVDAIPPGYEGYRVTGFVRHPLARMWSLYKYCATLDARHSASWVQADVLRVVESVQQFKGFEDWLLNCTEHLLPSGNPHPQLYQLHRIPENRKSQAIYLRPDLGTEIVPFSDLDEWMDFVGLPALHKNASPPRPIPPTTPAIEKHLAAYMGWELSLGLEVT
jgi:hypothetical protein